MADAGKYPPNYRPGRKLMIKNDWMPRTASASGGVDEALQSKRRPKK
jgi:hypothetical protein